MPAVRALDDERMIEMMLNEITRRTDSIRTSNITFGAGIWTVSSLPLRGHDTRKQCGLHNPIVVSDPDAIVSRQRRSVGARAQMYLNLEVEGLKLPCRLWCFFYRSGEANRDEQPFSLHARTAGMNFTMFHQLVGSLARGSEDT
ncbi:MAG: hypothetical protein ABW185_11540 [Sedimenticola sp.]